MRVCKRADFRMYTRRPEVLEVLLLKGACNFVLQLRSWRYAHGASVGRKLGESLEVCY